jgi:hypothetical protein
MSAEEHSTTVAAASDQQVERRFGPDRRRHSWRTLTYCGLRGRGRRRQARRRNHNYYLDRYAPGLVFTGLLLVLLSSLDAALTLTLLDKGAYEANYVMAQLLAKGDGPFVITKIAITVAGVLILLAHAHFQVLRVTNGKRALEFLVCVYGLLIGWELLLLRVIE